MSDLNAWRQPTGEWMTAKAVSVDPANAERFTSTAGQGILVNGPKAKTVDLISQEEFGDAQVHVEFCIPRHSNSGVYLMARYEVQVMDGFDNKTYADGQAAAIYGQNPPLVNACRPPGQWQTYDIIFHRPHFKADGSVERPARMTVFLNGVLIQDNFELVGPTANQARPPYKMPEMGTPVGSFQWGSRFSSSCSLKV